MKPTAILQAKCCDLQQAPKKTTLASDCVKWRTHL